MPFKAIRFSKQYMVAVGAIAAMLFFNPAQAQDVTLVVTPAPNGTITSAPGGIQCSMSQQTACSDLFPTGTSVQLTATPDAGFKFTGWISSKGFCTGGTNPCIFTIDETGSVAATFSATTLPPPPSPTTFPLKVGYTGDGSVTSAPAGIDCGLTCEADFGENTQVTLTATPAKGYRFTHWEGACTGTSDTCNVTMDAAKTVDAVFDQDTSPSNTFVLTLGRTGAGTVTSTPAGIDCGVQCSAPFIAGTDVTLTATPAAGHDFTGWTGACSGMSACTVTMDAAKKVDAQFTPIPVNAPQYALTVSTQGNGTVTSAPAGIDCGTTCTFDFDANDTVTLTATAQASSSFTSWGGACSGTANTCTVTMDAAKDVTAQFGQIQAPGGNATLTIHKIGEGHISSTPPGILCGTACEATFEAGKTVTLAAFPNAGHRLLDWDNGSGSSACIGSGPDYCIVALNQNSEISPVFVLDTCSSRSFSPAEKLVLDAYIAYYGRAPLASGLRYWANRMTEEGGNIWSIIGPFSVSDEYTRRFGGKTNRDLVDNLYQQLYGRAAEPAGLNWYAAELDAQRKTLSTIALNILDGTGGDDQVVLDNRRRVARYFAFITERRASSLDDGQLATLMANVTANYASANDACNTLSGSLR